MCGRFTLTPDPRRLSTTFELPDVPATYRPRYNVAPAQLVAVIGLKPDGKTRGMVMLSWGFVPRWASGPRSGPRPINARAETVDLKEPFRESFRDRRCLIPAGGFYEWEASPGKKIPHHFRLKSGEPFAFAGLWDVWTGGAGQKLLTCAIITVPANPMVRPYHDRMPAILPPEAWDTWLSFDSRVPDLLPLLASFPADEMEDVKVGQAVNKVANEGPECIAPAA